MNQRMVALVKMLSSPNDGEVVNAARMIGKMLVAHGLDWHDLGTYLARWPGVGEPVAPPPPPPRAADVRPRAQTYRGWNRRAPNKVDDVDVEAVQAKVDELGGYTHQMKRQDRDLIESLIDKFDMYKERTFISSPQRDWVDNLYRNWVENKRGRHR